MDVLITDEAKIAMASEEDAGDSDNRNGQALLDLQSNSKTVGGAKSFNDAYASLVSDIGNKTATLKTSSTAQGNVVTQLSNQQQSISGVDLDEVRKSATFSAVLPGECAGSADGKRDF